MLFRITQKTSEQIHEKRVEGSVEENRYCEWVVDIVFGADKKKYFLVTNAYASFSVVIPAKGITKREDFTHVLISEIEKYFIECGFSNIFDTYIKPNTSNVTIAKTNNRSISAIMNSLKIYFKYAPIENKSLIYSVNFLNSRHIQVNSALSEKQERPMEAILFSAMTKPCISSEVLNKKTKPKKLPKYKNENGDILTNPRDIAQEICWSASDIRDDIPEGRRYIKKLAKKALDYFPNCADAYALLASYSETPKKQLEFALQGKIAFEEDYGLSFIEKNRGFFWGITETRPYIRVLWHYSEALRKLGENKKAVECMEYMLELCPEDNIGIRYQLFYLYIKMGLFNQVKKMFFAHNEESTEFLYGRLLLLLAENSSNISEMNFVYKKALDENKFIPSYLLRKDDIPNAAIEYSYGSEEEAHTYTYFYGDTWKQYSQAMKFLESKV